MGQDQGGAQNQMLNLGSPIGSVPPVINQNQVEEVKKRKGGGVASTPTGDIVGTPGTINDGTTAITGGSDSGYVAPLVASAATPRPKTIVRGAPTAPTVPIGADSTPAVPTPVTSPTLPTPAPTGAMFGTPADMKLKKRPTAEGYMTNRRISMF